MNAICERFNRTTQEECIHFYYDLPAQDWHAFNDQLLAYIQRYNGDRTHQSLGRLTPCQLIAQKQAEKPSMWWPGTQIFPISPSSAKLSL